MTPRYWLLTLIFFTHFSSAQTAVVDGSAQFDALLGEPGVLPR